MLELKNIALKYNDKWLLKNFNLKVYNNESIALTGVSGGGKSSIFNMILGFYKQDVGEIYFNDVLLNSHNCNKFRKEIAYLPQNYNIIDSGTVYESIMKPFYFENNKNIQISKDLILNEFDKLNLDRNIIDNAFNSASGGEKQRIALIITKLLNRKIILLDEPTSALDKENKILAANYIFDLNQQCLITITHDQEWIDLCTKQVELKNE